MQIQWYLGAKTAVFWAKTLVFRTNTVVFEANTIAFGSNIMRIGQWSVVSQHPVSMKNPAHWTHQLS